MSLTADQSNDLVLSAQRNLGKFLWTDLTGDLQSYTALPNIFQKKKVMVRSGTHVQWNIMKDDSGAARNSGLYDLDQVNVVDVMIQAHEGWAMITTNWTMEHIEMAMNAKPSMIFDIAKERKAASMISLAKKLESQWWGKPDGPNDKNKMLGIFYWLNWVDVAGNGGFNSGDPVGFPSGAGHILSTELARWQNWCATYKEVTRDDLISKMREASVKTLFEPPIPVADYKTGSSKGVYTNYRVLSPFERSLEQQNDSLGNDLASKDGKVMFRGTPVQYVPYLEQNDTTDPVIGVDWSSIQPVFLDGWFMKEHPSKISPLQRNVSVVHQDSTMQYIMRDRRTSWYLRKAA